MRHPSCPCIADSEATVWRPWLDKEDLLPGQDWQRAITEAVRTADVVLVCLSKCSIAKTGYVQREIAYALDRADEHPEDRIYLIPVKLEPCQVPQRLSRWQWVNLFEERGYEKLLASLKTHAVGQRREAAEAETNASWSQEIACRATEGRLQFSCSPTSHLDESRHGPIQKSFPSLGLSLAGYQR